MTHAAAQHLADAAELLARAELAIVQAARAEDRPEEQNRDSKWAAQVAARRGRIEHHLNQTGRATA